MNEMSTKMKKAILIIINILTLSSCGVLFDDPIERFWNNGVMPSQNEMEAYSLCIRKSEEMYPQSKILMVLKEFHIQEPAWNKKDTGSIDDVSKSMLKN